MKFTRESIVKEVKKNVVIKVNSFNTELRGLSTWNKLSSFLVFWLIGFIYVIFYNYREKESIVFNLIYSLSGGFLFMVGMILVTLVSALTTEYVPLLESPHDSARWAFANKEREISLMALKDGDVFVDSLYDRVFQRRDYKNDDDLLSALSKATVEELKAYTILESIVVEK